MTHNVLITAGVLTGVWLASFVVIYISLGMFVNDTTDPEVVYR